MHQTIKVAPAERSETDSKDQFPEQTSSLADQTEYANSSPKKEAKNKTKQYILIALVIFNTITCISLIITLPIVLKDSDNQNVDSTLAPTSIPDFTTPIRTENSVLVLSTFNDAQPFVLDFDGEIVIGTFIILLIITLIISNLFISL